MKPSVLIADTYRLDSISVEGNYRVSDEAVVNYSRLKVGETTSSENLNDAYNKVLNTGLFSSVELKQLNKGVIIFVKEYSTVNEISLREIQNLLMKNFHPLFLSNQDLFLRQLLWRKI